MSTHIDRSSAVVLPSPAMERLGEAGLGGSRAWAVPQFPPSLASDVVGLLHDGVVALSDDRRIAFANAAIERLLGFAAGELIGRHVDTLLPPDLRAGHAAAMTEFANGDNASRLMGERSSVVAMRSDGTRIPVTISITRVRTRSGLFFVAVVHDIGELVRQQAAKEASEARFRCVLEHSTEAVLLLDAEQRITYASPSAHRLLGHIYAPSGRLTDKEWSLFVHPDDSCSVMDLLSGERTARWTDVRARAEGGGYVHLAICLVDLRQEPALQGFALHARDVTAERAAEAALAHSARHDSLTGLANRALLDERLSSAIADIGGSSRAVAVVFLDIDHFKRFNDSAGHAAGDHILQTVSARLRSSLRWADTIARFGGDEFVLVCRLAGAAEELPVRDQARVAALGRRVLELVAEPMWVDGVRTVVTVSVGISICSDSAAEAEAVLADADSALYLAKHRGRNTSVVVGRSGPAGPDAPLVEQQIFGGPRSDESTGWETS